MSVISLPVCKKKNVEVSTDIEVIHIEVAEKIESVRKGWETISGNNVFFSVDYLKTLEDNPADGITPYYILFHNEGQTVGIAYFQWKYFKLHENIRENTHQKNIGEKLKRSVIKTINFPTLICGNLLLTGKYGFQFHQNIPEGKQWKYLDEGITKLTSYLHSKGKSVGLVLAKDFMISQQKHIPYNSFIEFVVQPTMMMNIRKDWHHFDNYMEAMKSKYRVRLKKAKTDLSEIVKREFTAEEISQHKDKIYSLYKNVSDQANFNSFFLHKDYFENLKIKLGDSFTFLTYWKDHQMIGFSSIIRNQDFLHAHFLGYNKEINKNCHLYQNMLYDIVDQAIQTKIPHIDFSRTAIEIKSTVGAHDVPLFLYIKHVNPLWNKVVGPILNLVKPNMEYTIRHPFRENVSGD